MTKKYKSNDNMKGSTDMPADEVTPIVNNVEVAPAKEKAEPKPEPKDEVKPEAAETKEAKDYVVSVDLFGNVRHISIPNVK
jgi:hypothetical protein